ncbi:LEAF RUST 10 DISEASE-RESISTANCE LOCUS RECEPTOR-LIKE PROTEIN KINASE-like 1.1 isoform X2 [Tripterygium wilfordii]|uniref:LEAF RUST 10 DISEASE-RESISTANCE LOCUS RECEPTOR-LIKE PROTEIN KINASE-like 1.1 isoform X2 n=1 Tax=Tripterygium wilfordii TaxID=458696 RepID=UPI0018F81362|nr:LEAF RUST 10 DISEASE-RESISTANCE LOCUS RECEPTOR-LIKE PROTEIN KINASE-like 1.1 isoform X2 [Tripterygium wilfordii]
MPCVVLFLMAGVLLFVFLALSRLMLLSADDGTGKTHPNCPPFKCGNLGEPKFPFTTKDRPEYCGLFLIEGCDADSQKIRLERKGPLYPLQSISQAGDVTIKDERLEKFLNHRDLQCEGLNNVVPPNSSSISFSVISKINLLKCHSRVSHTLHTDYNHTGCPGYVIYYNGNNRKLPNPPPPQCLPIQLPEKENSNFSSIFSVLTATLHLQVLVSPDCYQCHYQGGECQTNSKGEFQCYMAHIRSNSRQRQLRLKLGLGLGIGGPAILMAIISAYVFRLRHYKRECNSTHSNNASSDLSSKSDLEGGTVCFGVPIFSYRELEEATNHFDSEKELGDGGFGTVYYGKLRDGREVAVKRLYQHNYRKVKIFMNEVEIHRGLRHKNLVTLYGCTSRRSRELLLVYEYVSKGTVADHLHGDRADPSSLPWAIRLSIAIETASALAYLHASDIIHRDVKTTNILLDNNFCVKVADFGLSRLFPTDVTHVSTAPQGTPGYVDPEYHQCYQLTEKSDVYSFGVVLIELISSMPAVDLSRDREEINLANLAIDRIKKCAFDQLIDKSLDYESDDEVRKMITDVAKLAFRCLQHEKEMRPSMKEALKELEMIQNGESKSENAEGLHDNHQVFESERPPPSPSECDELVLLKNIRLPASPLSVTEKWVSVNTTPNSSS